MTQFINCAFKEGQRAYLYANEGDPVGVGQWVDVEAKHGGVRSVIVVEIDCEAPQKFIAKPIIGKTAPKELEADRDIDQSQISTEDETAAKNAGDWGQDDLPQYVLDAEEEALR